MAIAFPDDVAVVNAAPSISMTCTGLLTKSQRLLLGLLVLLLVDVIWVLSSELTEVWYLAFYLVSVLKKSTILKILLIANVFHLQYIFHNTKFDKPFFTTYFKTSMFMIYLFGFGVSKSWRYQCRNHQYQVNSGFKKKYFVWYKHLCAMDAL